MEPSIYFNNNTLQIYDCMNLRVFLFAQLHTAFISTNSYRMKNIWNLFGIKINSAVLKN